MGTRPAILVDTNIIIEAVRVGAWERLRAHETVVTVRQCCEEALSGIPDSPGRVPVTAAQLGPPLFVVEVPDSQRAALLVAHEAAATLGAGEQDLLAHALVRFASGPKASPGSDFRIICADQAAIRVAITMGLSDNVVSLEEVLRDAEVTANGELKGHYTRRRLEEWKTRDKPVSCQDGSALNQDLDKLWSLERPRARYHRIRKPAECPRCGSKRIAVILYGLPSFTPELEQDLADGRVVLGGCILTPEDPAWKCVDCGVYIGKGRKL